MYEGKIDCTTDAVTDEGITFYLKAVTVEGGGILHGTYMTFNVANVTVDACVTFIHITPPPSPPDPPELPTKSGS
jgi:hypothetical protein